MATYEFKRSFEILSHLFISPVLIADCATETNYIKEILSVKGL